MIGFHADLTISPFYCLSALHTAFLIKFLNGRNINFLKNSGILIVFLRYEKEYREHENCKTLGYDR